MISQKTDRRRNNHQQSGQALVLGLFLLSLCCIAALGLLRAAQLLQQKTQLLTATDAASYSVGVLHARLLNVNAYLNQALLTHEMGMIQTLTIANWANYVDNIAAPNRVKTLQAMGVPSHWLSQLSQLHGLSALIYQEAIAKASQYRQSKLRLQAMQNQVNRAITHSRKSSLQQLVAGMGLNSRWPQSIYGWHKGAFQGINQADAHRGKEKPFMKNIQPQAVNALTASLRRWAAQQGFFKMRNRSFRISTACPKFFYRNHEITYNAISGWKLSDTLRITNLEHCKTATLNLVFMMHAQAAQAHSEIKLQLQEANVPAEDWYRFRIQRRFLNWPEYFPAHAKQNFRTTVATYYRAPQHVQQKASLFRPYWHARLVILSDE